MSNNLKKLNLAQMASTKHVCQVCGKGPVSANLRSHAMNQVKTVRKPNTQPVEIDGVKLTMCTRCMRTLSKKITL